MTPVTASPAVHTYARRHMRWLVLVTIVSLFPGPAYAAPLEIKKISAPDFGYAEWLPDGSGFYVVSPEKLRRYDAGGRPRGPDFTLAGLPTDAVLAPPFTARQGLSFDGKKLALLVSSDPGSPSLW